MRDHAPNCEKRILGSANCTCGAPLESYPTSTTNEVTDVDVIAPREPTSQAAAPVPKSSPAPVSNQNDLALRLLNDELNLFSMIDGKDAVLVCQVLRRLITRLNGE